MSLWSSLTPHAALSRVEQGQEKSWTELVLAESPSQTFPGSSPP